MNQNEKRFDMINILRLICAYLVVVVHLVAFGSMGNFAKIITSDFICRIAVPFFFITSGYFFYANVNKEGYFKKYFIKLIKTYVAITVVYLISFIPTSMYLVFIQNGVVYTIKALLVNGISQSLWYFPGLIVSSAFVYIFIKKNLIKPLIVVSTILFAIGLIGDCYLALIKSTPFINIVNLYDSIFDNTRNGITFGVPFITIGILIKKYNLNEKIKKPSRLFILFFVIYAVEAYILINGRIINAYNFCFSLALLVPVIFIVALNSKVTITNETSRYIREMSLWIYAFHELIYIQLCNLELFGQASSPLVYFFVCGVVTVLAYTISRIRLKGMALNKTASRKIVLYSGLVLIIAWALIKTPIATTTSVSKIKSYTFVIASLSSIFSILSLISC
jgi:hypothetical protein